MSPDAGRLRSDMLESVQVGMVVAGHCPARGCHTLYSKLLLDLMPAYQSGLHQKYGHIFVSSGQRKGAYVFKIVCLIGIKIGRHTLCASHRALDQVVGHFDSGRNGNATASGCTEYNGRQRNKEGKAGSRVEVKAQVWVAPQLRSRVLINCTKMSPESIRSLDGGAQDRMSSTGILAAAMGRQHTGLAGDKSTRYLGTLGKYPGTYPGPNGTLYLGPTETLIRFPRFTSQHFMTAVLLVKVIPSSLGGASSHQLSSGSCGKKERCHHPSGRRKC